MDRDGRKQDVGVLLGAAEGAADELLEQFRGNHDRLDRKEADKSQLYPDMDANALRRLRHRGSDHGLDGSDKEGSDEEDGDFEEESEESDEEEDDKDFEDDDKDVEEGIPELVGSEEGDDDRKLMIAVNEIDAFVLFSVKLRQSDINL
jgi:hypothetical protein